MNVSPLLADRFRSMSGRIPVRLGLLPALLFLAAFFVAPIVELVWRSFAESATAPGSSQYLLVLSDPYYLKVIANTFVLSGIVTLICLIIGYPVAYFLIRFDSRFHTFIVLVLLLPLLTSLIMRTFGWQIILARQGILNSFLMYVGWTDKPIQLLQTYPAIIIGMVHLYVPFAVISIASVLQSVDSSLEEMAISLGANKRKAFLEITLPLTVEGILTGGVLIFMMANGAFVTVLLLGGNSVITLPLLIYQQFTIMRNFQMGAILSTVLLLASLLVLLLQLSALRGKQR